MMVVWHHATDQIAGLGALFPNNFGTSGVDLFFVISGFIMVITTQGSSVRPAEFMRRRIVRVVPLYWLLTLSMVAVALVAPSLFKSLKVTPLALVQSLLFVPHFSVSFPERVWPLLVPGWTLSFEMFFYAAMAVSLYLPSHRRIAALLGFFGMLTAIGLAFGPFDSAAARTYTDPMMLEFAVGAVIGMVWSKGRLQLPVALSVGLVVLGAVLLLQRDRPPFGNFNPMIGAVLVVMGALNERWAGLRNKTLQALGDSSYSLYLTHLFALAILRIVWGKLLPGAPALPWAIVFMLAALTFSAFVGWWSYRWIETPLLKRMNGPRRLAPVVASSQTG